MYSQRGLATIIGVLFGTVVYLVSTYFNSTGFLSFYGNVKLGGLLIILFAAICSARFYQFVTPFIIIYEKIRYIGNRPHRELQITNDSSFPLAIFVAVLLTLLAAQILPSSRLVYGVFAGTLVARIVKIYLMYSTGYSCRLLWPFTNRSYKTTDVMPECELRVWWKPVQTYSISFLFVLYVLTIPILQEVSLTFAIRTVEMLQLLGI